MLPSPVHVAPSGPVVRDHEISRTCWCHPRAFRDLATGGVAYVHGGAIQGEVWDHERDLVAEARRIFAGDLLEQQGQ